MDFNRKARLHTTLSERARIVASIRDFFTQDGYLAVETPVCLPAPLPEPYINAFASDCGYLQTSPEICMKPLLAAGFGKIFQISPCFRQGERGRRHLPEFTMLEWYAGGQSYTDLMETCEALFEKILADLSRPSDLTYQSRRIDVRPPWPRLSVSQAFHRYGGETLAGALANDHFDEIMGLKIEPRLALSQPVFLYDYPARTSPLAAPHPDNPELAQRFELYMAGLEICNGCTELADPEFQKRRFERELKRRRIAGLPEYPLPSDFLDALADMPEAAGCALGVDRLVMLLTDSAAIDEVVAFTPNAF